MKKFIALVGLALIAGLAAAADVQKIVIAKAEVNAPAMQAAIVPDAQKVDVARADVKAPAKRAVTAPIQKPQNDSRFDNYRLESFSCCSLPQ